MPVCTVHSIQYITIQYCTYSTIYWIWKCQYVLYINTIQYNTIQYNTIQYNTVYTVQYTGSGSARPGLGCCSGHEGTRCHYRLVPPIATHSSSHQYWPTFSLHLSSSSVASPGLSASGGLCCRSQSPPLAAPGKLHPLYTICSPLPHHFYTTSTPLPHHFHTIPTTGCPRLNGYFHPEDPQLCDEYTTCVDGNPTPGQPPGMSIKAPFNLFNPWSF